VMEILMLLEQQSLLFWFVAFVFGLVVGSFLNVVILRMPPVLEYNWKKDFAEYNESEFSEESPKGIAFSRSYCPQCKTQLKAWHNIPVLSYLFLRGKCAFCQSAISFRYPLIEVLTALLTLLLAVKFGPSIQFLAVCMMLWMLVVITMVDYDTYLIPDQLSLSLLWLGLFFSLFDFSINPSEAISGALIGYLVLWAVFHIFKFITKKEGMGYGDFKLLAAGGAWLGAEPLILVLLVSSVSGLVFAVMQMAAGKSQKKIPFGPYLSIGIFVIYLYGDILKTWLF